MRESPFLQRFRRRPVTTGIRLWLTGLALGSAGLGAASPRLLMGTGLALVGADAAGRLLRRHRATRSDVAAQPTRHATVDALGQLDHHMLGQLGHAVALSERASMAMMDRIAGLRGLSSRLMDYLRKASEQSTHMQAEIDRNGSIVAELAGFVQQLPQQIAQERQYLETLVAEVQQLASITETIRTMARQTEILSINAAIAAAHAGEAGRSFAVLADEVRRLATQSSESATDIEHRIRQLVGTVQARSGGEFARRMQHNEAEAARLLALTGKLDDGYLDMRQFYAMLLTAITEHNGALDRDITALLDTVQYQDVFKQIVDRLTPAFEARHGVVTDLITRPGAAAESGGIERQAQSLVDDYLNAEAAHRSPEPSRDGRTGQRIELF